jgi:hypothetical protein
MRARAYITVLTVLAIASCGAPEPPATIVAKVGKRAIDQRELQRSYNLHPQWKKGQTQLQAYMTQVNELVIQKVYALEAERLGLDRDTLMTGYLDFIKKKEMIKGLYRKEVRSKVQVTEAEERRMYEYMKKKVDFEYVFSRDSALCTRFAQQLGGRGVERLVLPQDSSVRAGRRTNEKVGSIAPELESVLFTARQGELKGPVKVAGGFMAVKVTGGTQEKFLAENDFILQRQKIQSLLTDRKADSLASHYVYITMRDKDLRLNPSVFWAVAEHFSRRVQEAHVDPMKIQNVNVTGDELLLLEGDLNVMRNAIVATHREGSLTVGELLKELSHMPGSLRPRARTPQNLKDAIGGIVRNQYFLKEAERQGLDKDAEVLYEYGLQRDETLASAYYAHRKGEVQVTPEEVAAFKKQSNIPEEQVFFKINMTSLARDAKTDSVVHADLPRLESEYNAVVDSARVRSLLTTPDAVLTDDPVRIYLREIFM